MSKEPKISVIMSVYNGERYVSEAIESILNQTFADFEFIIVNDGSTDGSLEIIQTYNDTRIRLLNNETNLGIPRSSNKALEQARAQYIARMDADDVSVPNRFELQLKYFEEHPQTALVGTDIYTIDDAGKVLWEIRFPSNLSRSLLLQGNKICHGSIMFKKEIIDRLGMYNELFAYSVDYELYLRIAQYYNVSNLNTPLYKWRAHSGNISFVQRREQILYAILARKLAQNELGGEVLGLIKGKGISELCPHLTKEENIFLHKASAYGYVMTNNLRSARTEWVEAIRLNPLDVRIYAAILLSLLGKRAIAKVYQMSARIRSIRCR